jgi:hypothetical protein
VVLALEAPQQHRLRAFVNGQAVALLVAGPGLVTTTLPVPAAALYRGDNVLTLAADGPHAGVRLRRYLLRPALSGE